MSVQGLYQVVMRSSDMCFDILVEDELRKQEQEARRDAIEVRDEILEGAGSRKVRSLPRLAPCLSYSHSL